MRNFTVVLVSIMTVVPFNHSYITLKHLQEVTGDSFQNIPKVWFSYVKVASEKYLERVTPISLSLL